MSTVIAIVLGMGWFGPIFGKQWAEVIGMKDPSDMTPVERKEAQGKMMPAYIVNVVLTLIMMLVLYYFIKGWSTLSGMTVACIAWLGFVVPLMAGQALWGGKSKRLAWQMFLLTSGYQLICFVVAGAIYGGMK